MNRYKKLVLILLSVVSFLNSEITFAQGSISFSEFKSSAYKMVNAWERKDYKTACNYGITVKKYLLDPKSNLDDKVRSQAPEMLEGVNQVCGLNEEANKISKSQSEMHCSEYLTARQRCSVAGSYEQCMRINFPYYRDESVFPLICSKIF